MSMTNDSQLRSEAAEKPFQEVPSSSSILDAKARHGRSICDLLPLTISCPASFLPVPESTCAVGEEMKRCDRAG